MVVVFNLIYPLTFRITYIMAPQTGSSLSEGNGVSIFEEDGSKFVRLVVKFVGYGIKDLIVRPVEDKLLILEKPNAILGTYDLPESVDPFTVDADMTSDGLLTVTAAMKC